MRVTIEGSPQIYDMSDLRVRRTQPNDLMVVQVDGQIAHIPDAFHGEQVLRLEASRRLARLGLIPTLFHTPSVANVYPLRETGGEVAFIASLLGDPLRAGRVLDVGCGVGRLLKPLVGLGYEVEGLDASLESIAALDNDLQRESREVPTFVADMAFFVASNRYAWAVSAMNTLRYCGSPERLRNHFICMARTLNPAGRYLINFSVQNGSSDSASTDRSSWRVGDVHYEWRHGMQSRHEGIMDEIVTVRREGDPENHVEIQQQTWMTSPLLRRIVKESGWEVAAEYDEGGRLLSDSRAMTTTTKWLLLQLEEGCRDA